MKRLPLTLLFCFPFLLSCTPENPSGNSSSYPWIIPENPFGAKVETNDITTQNELIERMASIARAPAPEGLQILSVENINLDADRIEEQTLVLKNEQSEDLYLAVVDYDEVLGNYILSWSHPLTTDSFVTLSITQEDLLGDREKELVCFGLSSDGSSSLDVFRKTRAPEGTSLYYKPIYSLQSAGSIEIERTPRSTAYQNNQANGISFPIITQIHPAGSDNLLDIEKTTYRWQFPRDEYVLTDIELIPGQTISSDQLRGLYSSDITVFKEHLNGAWLKSSPQNPDRGLELCFFDAENDLIYYSSHENPVQEIYQIEWQSKRSNYLSMRIRNIFVPKVYFIMSFVVNGLDTMAITTNYSATVNPLDGSYQQLDMSYLDSYPRLQMQSEEEIELSGIYNANRGNRYQFRYPSYTLTFNGIQTSGQYDFYQLKGIRILEMQEVSENGIPGETVYFQLEYSESESSTRIIRTLSLTEGQLEISGFQPFQEATPIIYEQIEFLEEEED